MTAPEQSGVRECARCGASLEGKKWIAIYCSRACKDGARYRNSEVYREQTRPEQFVIERSRVLSKIDIRSTDECWEWKACRRADGYGRAWFKGRMMNAHRAVYELLVGPIPAGMQIDHLCRNRRCVNPSHLEPVTNRENALRGESFAARNAAKTHCAKGHLFDGANTLFYGKGWRRCRECNRARQRRYDAIRRGEVAS